MWQQLAQQASSACGLRTGDVLGTGTVSGDAVDAASGGMIVDHLVGCAYGGLVELAKGT